ncbi:hypothetical protein J7K05_02165 [bacterium]|nr:hypothetical protein [bacterium]
MFIKIAIIVAVLVGAFLVFRLLLFLVRSTLGIGWGIIKALFLALFLLVLGAIIVYLYLRFKMLSFFNLGL